MLSIRNLFRILITFVGTVILISRLGGFPHCYGSNKPLASGINKSDQVVTEPEASSCGQDLCLDIYPKDGKIEGKPVSVMTPAGVNSRGQVVGLCALEDPEKKYPFVREPDGRIWIFRTPSESGQGEFTDISDSGKAVGFYEKVPSSTKIGFLMNSQGRWVMDIQYPSGACPSSRSYLHTEPNGINNGDEIIGNYDCTENPGDAADPIFKGNGFYRAPDGTFYRIQFENAQRTVAGKISNNGTIFGYYVVEGNVWIPFAAPKDDVIKPLVP
jgi:hypothetical protein